MGWGARGAGSAQYSCALSPGLRIPCATHRDMQLLGGAAGRIAGGRLSCGPFKVAFQQAHLTDAVAWVIGRMAELRRSYARSAQ